jgi:hypothetical protein
MRAAETKTLATTQRLRGGSRALPDESPRAARVVVDKKKEAHGGNMVSPVLELDADD